MGQKSRVNDFVVRIATVNGTGSASANSLLMKAIFRMGIPVVGKNYFPSNIQGLPTWYEIRVTGAGYLSRSGQTNIMVAMNAQTYGEDLCVHCSLCAERCPTGAWDMRKSTLLIPYAIDEEVAWARKAG